MNNDLPIALFDSGVGGLTVFRAIKKLLPDETLLYLGDTARVPYGTRSKDTIIRYTCNAAKKLLERGAKMLVIACNTATSAALPYLREQFSPIPVMGVVEPGARAAVQASKNGRIVVIATEATIRGEAYQKAIGNLDNRIKIITRPCTLFVALAEEGWANGPIAEAVAKKYLADLFPEEHTHSFRPDTLLLGCTHFPLFSPVLSSIAGNGVTLVDSANATAQEVKNYLLKNGMKAEKKQEDAFFTTDNIERFISSGKLFLGEDLDADRVELVDL